MNVNQSKQDEYGTDNNILNLTNDEFLMIALSMPYEDISSFCQTNLKFNTLICDNDYFWKLKYFKDFDNAEIDEDVAHNTTWRELYRTTGLLFICGNNAPSITEKIGSKYILTRLFIGPKYNVFKKIALGSKFVASINAQNEIWIAGNLFADNAQHTVNFLAKDISAGDKHLLITDMDDNLCVIGQNTKGQLGTYDDKGTLYKFDDLKVKKIFAGNMQSFIVDMDNKLWACGNNLHGQLGLGNDNTNMIEFTFVADLNIDIGNIKKIVSDTHTVILTEEGNCWVCGNNDKKQLGITTSNNTVFNLVPEIKAKDVAIGKSHTIIIDVDNNIWSAGTNVKGCLGLGVAPKTISKFKKSHKFKATNVASFGYHTFFTQENGEIYACGENLNNVIPETSATIVYRPIEIKTRLHHKIFTSDTQTVTLTNGPLIK